MKLSELVRDFGALEETHVFELVKLTHRSHPIALRSPIEKALIDFTDSLTSLTPWWNQESLGVNGLVSDTLWLLGSGDLRTTFAKLEEIYTALEANDQAHPLLSDPKLIQEQIDAKARSLTKLLSRLRDAQTPLLAERLFQAALANHIDMTKANKNSLTEARALADRIWGGELSLELIESFITTLRGSLPTYMPTRGYDESLEVELISLALQEGAWTS